ncbi:AfsR/SARP family transcriptional regulator [Kutzneria kofuensis]|uniref:DNA-binding SARP family transcriptional activator/Tfp pilus assembly protein PilF n=1 Tax=Kutzneria kofuensis TaxID=103725 RepID=A0A7W9KGQ9_9PSEU|nr:BTAD domain-containing putative transcriptional regulator [Kutzneria kofuensis]MBB5892120.1 DNA-binding SARP family transcriptional activator/Tfp pilus assembly protein PilF [Kutzneria kofuensis]
MAGEIEFRVLGPLEVLIDGGPRPLPAAKQRLLLGSLLLRANHAVSAAELVDVVWGERPPAGARNTLRTYVMRLRQQLGPACALRTAQDGYALDVPAGSLDAARFRELLVRARAVDDAATVWSLLTEALALWRGPVLADVPLNPLRHDEINRLEAERLDARERRIDAGLTLGRHEELVPELRELADANPARERVWAQLMVALYRSGRRADALHVYREVYEYLSDELGVDPGAELLRVRQAVLSDHPSLRISLSAKVFVPAQLPPEVINFVGREAAAAQVAERLAPAEPPAAAPVVVLTGPPGTGKTALAVHVAHRLRARFPDGQLFVDLRGHARVPALGPDQVLARFLRALGVAADDVPTELDEQSAALRSLLAGKRMLIVLDNAARPAQIRPVLPGDPGCAVLITSRDALRGLVAEQGASRVHVGGLTPAESNTLLARILGDEVVRVEPTAAAELAELCTHLPLALRIAAANMIGGGQPRLAEQLGRLREGNRLAALAADGDETVTVRAAFDLSYEALAEPAKRAFRLVGLAPCQDLTPEAMGALADCLPEQARRLLDQLSTANLVQQLVPGRYQAYDLLRVYAHERALAEPEDQALARLHTYYLHAVAEAADLLGPEVPSLVPLPPRPGPDRFGDRDEALDWMTTELPNLVPLIQQGSGEIVWQLVDSLRGFFYAQRLATEWQLVTQAGLTAASAAGDEVAEAAMRYNRGALDWSRGRANEAADSFARALEVFRRAGLRAGEYSALTNLAIALSEMGDLDGAATRFADALALAEGEPTRLAPVLFNLGLVQVSLGETEEGFGYLARARAICAELGIEHGEVNCLNNLLNFSRHMGRFSDVEEYFERGVAMSRRLGNQESESGLVNAMALVRLDFGRQEEAERMAATALELAASPSMFRSRIDALNTLGDVAVVGGRPAEAIEHYRQALDLSRQRDLRFGEVEALIGLTYAMRDDERALAHAEEAVALTGRHELRLCQGRALLAQAHVHLRRGEHGAAIDFGERALAMLRKTGLRLWEPRALTLLAAAYRATGHPDAADRHEVEAATLLSAMGLAPSPN